MAQSVPLPTRSRALQDVTSISNESTDKAACKICPCSKLTIADVPCATLSKLPEKCKKKELEDWLACRAIPYKKSSTRIALANRVRSLMENDSYEIVDPDPTQCHLRRKQNACSKCNGNLKVHQEIQVGKPKTKSVLLKLLPETGWTTSTECIPKQFTSLSLMEYLKTSGKNVKKTDEYVQLTLDKAYKFCYDGYFHTTTAAIRDNNVYVKSKCFHSQSKSDPPHNLCIVLNKSAEVLAGQCTCKAGVSGSCNHVIGLLYLIDHCVRLKLKQFPMPDQATCTDKPQVWHRPRTDGVVSEPIMTSVVYKPAYSKSGQSGIQPLLYDARKQYSRKTDNEKINKLQEHLKQLNPYFGFLQSVCTKEDPNACDTYVSLKVPRGSVLSYQLSVTEGNFRVISDFSSMEVKSIISLNEDYPKFPFTDTEEYLINAPHEIMNRINISEKQAHDLEESTRTQSDNDSWIAERKVRLTSSNFGGAISRKSAHEKFVKDNMTEPKDLSKVPAIKWGRKNEGSAVREYSKYMKNIGKKVKVFNCGLVVNPKCPFLATSPDRKIADSDFGYGLMEVKCPFSLRDVNPAEVASNDTSFFVQMVDGKPRLSEEHPYYYQVQGQMGITGARWCDFVVWTTKGLLIERIPYRKCFWESAVLKLKTFYGKHVVPVLNDS